MMEDLGDSAHSHDGTQYDNDFEKLPHDDDVISSSTTEGNTAGDNQGQQASIGKDDIPSFTSQLNVEQPAASHETTPSGKTSCSSCCELMSKLDPRVKDLIMWRDLKKSGVTFLTSLVVLIGLAVCSIISVISYISLAILTMTAVFRLYHHFIATIGKTEPTNPFREYLEMELTISDETTRYYSDIVAKHLTKVMEDARRLFFVESIVDTLKFALILWMLTYIGGWFNGMTLIVVFDVMLFTVPKIYELYQRQIDDGLTLVHGKLLNAWKRLEERIPLIRKLKQA